MKSGFGCRDFFRLAGEGKECEGEMEWVLDGVGVVVGGGFSNFSCFTIGKVRVNFRKFVG